MFGDLTKLENLSTFGAFITSALVIELIMIGLFRLSKTRLAGVLINKWYDTYGLDALLLDTLSVVIGFVLAGGLYGFIFSEFNVFYFLLVVLAVQITHDYLFYRYVITPIPKGHNKVIDTMKEYAEGVKADAILGDSLMYIMAVPVASLLLSVANSSEAGPSFLLGVAIFVSYPLMYLLYTRPIKHSS